MLGALVFEVRFEERLFLFEPAVFEDEPGDFGRVFEVFEFEVGEVALDGFEHELELCKVAVLVCAQEGGFDFFGHVFRHVVFHEKDPVVLVGFAGEFAQVCFVFFLGAAHHFHDEGGRDVDVDFILEQGVEGRVMSASLR